MSALDEAQPPLSTDGSGLNEGRLLETRGLQAGYGDVRVIWDLDLVVHRGELVALVGSNGAGKTTLLRALSGLIPCRGGSVVFSGQSLEGRRADERVGIGLVHVPEGRHLFADLTTEQNLILGANVRKDRGAVTADLARVYDLFPRLFERRRQAAGSMSGGEQQMCAIGPGMMAAPKLLMVDELSLGLAPLLVEQLFSTLLNLRSTGVTLLIVEQDVEITLEAADRGYVMEAGRISLSGPAEQLLHDPGIRSAYLGV